VDMILALIQRFVVSPGLTGRYRKVHPTDTGSGAFAATGSPTPVLQDSSI
jgi:hypothetical protein